MLILGALVVCLVLLDPLGFRISLFLFLLFLPFGLGVRNWWVIFLFAALGSFGIFHVFYYWLKTAFTDRDLRNLRRRIWTRFNTGFKDFPSPLAPTNLLYAFIGCVLGTLIGVLPGLGPAAGTAILIPVTFSLDPIGAIIMLAAIYYGAMYGGTITSVLVNVPGEAASVITCLDGYQMAKQGRAGPALGIAAIGSFIGGTFATFALMVVSLPLASFALRFGPPEVFALLVVGLSLVTGLSGRSLLAALIMTVFGLMLAMIGMDPVRGAPRFTFGLPPLYDGIGFIPVVMGLFGVGEILLSMEAPVLEIIKTKLTDLLPKKEEWKISSAAIGRGTVIGFFLGLIPGIGAIIPTFLAYVVEKKVSKHPEKFGTGVIEGVASPETANNSYANAAMVPLLTLGIPGSPTLAVLMGAFIIHGLTPGPFPFQGAPGRGLGAHRQPLSGQRHSPDSEPSPRRPLGQAPGNPLSVSLPRDPALLHPGGLQPESERL